MVVLTGLENWSTTYKRIINEYYARGICMRVSQAFPMQKESFLESGDELDDHLTVCFTQARNIDELTVINAEQIIRGNAEDRRKLDKNVIRRQTQIRFVCTDDRFSQPQLVCKLLLRDVFCLPKQTQTRTKVNHFKITFHQ